MGLSTHTPTASAGAQNAKNQKENITKNGKRTKIRDVDREAYVLAFQARYAGSSPARRSNQALRLMQVRLLPDDGDEPKSIDDWSALVRIQVVDALLSLHSSVGRAIPS